MAWYTGSSIRFVTDASASVNSLSSGLYTALIPVPGAVTAKEFICRYEQAARRFRCLPVTVPIAHHDRVLRFKAGLLHDLEQHPRLRLAIFAVAIPGFFAPFGMVETVFIAGCVNVIGSRFDQFFCPLRRHDAKRHAALVRCNGQYMAVS